MAPSYRTCTELSPQCPVEYTTYGYQPNLPANALFCAIFAVCGAAQVILGIRYKTWTWLATLSIGTLLEMAGYIGRILLHKNPWDSGANKLQIVALILAPSFIAAGIDLTLKHIVLIFGPQYSRIKPRWIPWIFIGVDFGAIVVQACGGALAAVAETRPELLQTGDNIIVAGLAIQVFQLAIFGLIAIEYAYKAYKHRAELNSVALTYARTAKFRYFISCVTAAYVAVLIRCIYRIPEMAGGWGKGLQRNEPKFLVLDGAMVVIAAIALTIAHPGIFFPYLGKGDAAHDRFTETEKDRPVEQNESGSGSERDTVV